MQATIKTKRKTKEINMTRGPILKNLIIYSIPLIFTNILQLLFNDWTIILKQA